MLYQLKLKDGTKKEINLCLMEGDGVDMKRVSILIRNIENNKYDLTDEDKKNSLQFLKDLN